MSKQKFYVVWKGRTPGVYSTWTECDAQVSGFANAKYKSYPTREEAQYAYENKTGPDPKPKPVDKAPKVLVPIENIIQRSICVDGACSVKTTSMEYQAVFTDTKETVFHQGPYIGGTNNIAEFLAIVHALAYCKKNNLDLPIYSDSLYAMSWVKNKQINSKMDSSDDNKVLVDIVNRALKWLNENTYTNKIIKWETKSWGENPADFGRK